MTTYQFTPNESGDLFNFTSGIGITDASGNTICDFPPNSTSKVNIKELKKNIEDYDISALKPGTVINLYNYDFGQENDRDNWHLASTNGWDIGSLNYCSNKTFWELWEEACQEFNLDWRSLPTNKTYSFIMHHPEIHFIGDKIRLWNIGEENPQLSQVPQPNSLSLTVNNMLKNCRNGVNSYFKQPNNPLIFGYILKHKTERKVYVLYSDLWSIFKKCIFRKIYNPQDKTPEEKRLYIALRTYLHLNHKMFIVKNFLSPLVNDVNEIRQTIDRLVDEIIADYQFPGEKIAEITQTFISQIKNEISMDNNSLHVVVRQFVLDPRRVNFLFDNWHKIKAITKEQQQN